VIHYHGLPMHPDQIAAQVMQGGHAMVTFADPHQLGIAAEVCKTFVVDNGAFSAWRSGKPIQDWSPFLEFALDAVRHPSCDWVVIPDVIDGTEAENDDLVGWFTGRWAVYRPDTRSTTCPVWHLHESFTRLSRLAANFSRVAIGSSGQYARPGTTEWWGRVCQALRSIRMREGGFPCRFHGLRMLDPKIFTRLPLSSADSTAVARNIQLDSKWRGSYQPPTKVARGMILRQRIEAHGSAADVPEWVIGNQGELFKEATTNG